VSPHFFRNLKHALKPLELTDKPLLDRYARRTPTKLSSYAFAPLYVWQDFFRFYWTIIDDRFCVFAKQVEDSRNGGDDYFMPIMPMGGPPSERSIREAYTFMLAENRARQIARIENVPAEDLPFFHAMGFASALKEMEYLYETHAMVHLKGNRYKSKRAAYNAFVRRYPSARIQPYHPDYLADCLRLYESWQQTRRAKHDDSTYQAMLDDSRSAHRTGLMNYEALGLVGGVVRIDGELSGYTFGYPLNSEVFCVLFEVTHPRVKGLAQFLFREFCRERSANRLIHAMGDSGLENIKGVKLSYRPCELIPSYNVFLPLDQET